MNGNTEAGFASAWALCLIFFILLAGVGLIANSFTVQRTTREYQRETRLDLMAESRLEAFAAKVERDAKQGDAFLEGKEQTKDREVSSGPIPIESWIVVRRQGKRLYCAAVAREHRVDGWDRRRTARTILERKEAGYVWIGWRP